MSQKIKNPFILSYSSVPYDTPNWILFRVEI
jgi:hypothetical protein